jgi:RNA polymerase sigma factor (sigma-70 family)
VSRPHSHDRWFAEEVLPHEPMLRAWLRSRFPSMADIDDLVQESYARLLKARAAATPIHSPKAFLFATARNLALDAFRHGRVTGIVSITENEQSRVLEDMPGIAEIIGHQQELDLLTRAIQALPDRCRRVLTLRKIYGLSQKEIAAQLGISEHTVEAQVGNGVRRCAEFLARYGLP